MTTPDYTAYRNADPRTILVGPFSHNSDFMEAADLVESQFTLALAKRGYEVIPTADADAELLQACRRCYRVPYYSQQIGKLERFIHRKHKLERRLEKPGLHQSTIDRISEKIYEFDDRIDTIDTGG